LGRASGGTWGDASPQTPANDGACGQTGSAPRQCTDPAWRPPGTRYQGDTVVSCRFAFDDGAYVTYYGSLDSPGVSRSGQASGVSSAQRGRSTSRIRALVMAFTEAARPTRSSASRQSQPMGGRKSRPSLEPCVRSSLRWMRGGARKATPVAISRWSTRAPSPCRSSITRSPTKWRTALAQARQRWRVTGEEADSVTRVARIMTPLFA